MPEPHTSEPEQEFSAAEVQAMQRAFIKLVDLWGLTDEQASTLMGEIPVQTLRDWKAGRLGSAGTDTAVRLSNVMGIHKALRLLFKDPVRGYTWIKRPNTAFSGATALEVMLRGKISDLTRVRQYLDAMRVL